MIFKINFKALIRKTSLFCIIGFMLGGCTAPIMLGYVITSPKLLFYANNKSYEVQLDVDLVINNQKIAVNPTVKCHKGDTYFSGAVTGSWEQKWNLELVNNTIYHNQKQYTLHLGNFDPRRKVYGNYKFSRGWCETFFKDSKNVKRINEDNSLVLIPNDNNGFENNKTISIYNNKIINKSFIYITQDNKENKQKNNISNPIADGVIIKNFKIHPKNLQDIADK